MKIFWFGYRTVINIITPPITIYHHILLVQRRRVHHITVNYKKRQPNTENKLPYAPLYLQIHRHIHTVCVFCIALLCPQLHIFRCFSLYRMPLGQCPKALRKQHIIFNLFVVNRQNMPIDLKGFHVFAAIVIVATAVIVVVKHYAYQIVGILCFCHKMMQSCYNTSLPVDHVQYFQTRNKKAFTISGNRPQSTGLFYQITHVYG